MTNPKPDQQTSSSTEQDTQSVQKPQCRQTQTLACSVSYWGLKFIYIPLIYCDCLQLYFFDEATTIFGEREHKL